MCNLSDQCCTVSYQTLRVRHTHILHRIHAVHITQDHALHVLQLRPPTLLQDSGHTMLQLYAAAACCESFNLHYSMYPCRPEMQVTVPEDSCLLCPLSNAAAVLARVLQREHARRPALILTMRGHPQVLGCKDAPPAVAAAGVSIHGWRGSWHQLEGHGRTCDHNATILLDAYVDVRYRGLLPSGVPKASKLLPAPALHAWSGSWHQLEGHRSTCNQHETIMHHAVVGDAGVGISLDATGTPEDNKHLCLMLTRVTQESASA